MIIDAHAHVTAPDKLYVYKAGLISHRGAHGRGSAGATDDDIKHALADWKTNENVTETLKRTLKHLALNKVDVSKTPLTLGPALTVNAAEETITGNADATALLTREYRAPFIVPKAEDV